jgi:hypothetical protein
MCANNIQAWRLVCAAALCLGAAGCSDGTSSGVSSGSSTSSGSGGPSGGGGGGEGTGGSGMGGGSSSTGSGGGSTCSTPPCDDLAKALGCAGPYNIDQVLDLRFTMAAGDWAALKADMTNSIYFEAEFQCNDDPPLAYKVGVRRKRSGSIDKPGLKVDINEINKDAEWQTLKKLSLENGVSEGGVTVEMGDLIAEYLSWRAMVRSGTISGRAAFTRVHVNGELLGVYVNVEQVDKRFLQVWLDDDDGWLYKLSGSDDDGYKTNEMTPNPYESALCFLSKNPCPTPSASELETYLPKHLDIPQLLRMGAVNAIVANADAPLVKDNNYYFYDWAGGGRLYMPWDLDTVMKEVTPLFDASGTTLYTGVLFTHWEDDYDAVLTELLEGPLGAGWMDQELTHTAPLVGSSLEADPFVIGGPFDDAAAKLKAWWSTRHPAIHQEVMNHQP